MRSVFLSVFFALTTLAGCDARAPAAQDAASRVAFGKTVSASLTGYNYTDKTIAAFYVNGQWGGNVFPGTGGGKFVCCVSLPVPWRDDTKVTVSWEDHELKKQPREVAVPKYDPDRIGSLNVHFLRDGQIRVSAGMTMLGHPDYPLKGKEAELKAGVPIDIHN